MSAFRAVFASFIACFSPDAPSRTCVFVCERERERERKRVCVRECKSGLWGRAHRESVCLYIEFVCVFVSSVKE